MLITTHSMQKEYEQIIRTPFVFRQVKPALWKAPLRVAFLDSGFCYFDAM